jgi:hypothetical protein
VQEFFLRAGLADDELDIVHQQHVEAAQALLNSIISFWRMAWTNSIMKRSAEQ